MTDYAILRDRFGRPMLYPPEGGHRVSYTRVSTAAKWLDDKSGLINWTASQAMVGLMKSKPLQARVSSIIARTNNDTYRENKPALKEVVESATQVAQASGRADYGTAFHEMSELLDSEALDWQYVPEMLKGPLEAYRTTMSGLEVADSEVFVTVDEGGLRLAGSMDRILIHPDLGPCASDVKTGTDEPRFGLGVTTQVAIYSRGMRYRDREFTGTPAFDDGEPNPDGTAWRKPLYEGLNRNYGLMIHCPLEKVDGQYRCDLFLLDLKLGWESLALGRKLKAARRSPKLEKIS